MVDITSFQRTVQIVSTLAAFMCISSLAQAYQYDQTARLINERLSYMKDVAGYKAEQHFSTYIAQTGCRVQKPIGNRKI
jgi:chorismate mutase